VETAEFLDSVITSSSDGYLVLCSRNHSITWTQEFHQWPEHKAKILERIDFLRQEYDLYFSAHLFSDESAEKSKVLQSRTIQADLDNVELEAIDLEPSILVETSPKRYQAYWILDTPTPDTTVDITTEALELLSKRITYAIPNSDHSGWSLGHRLRIPGSLNFKYNNGPHPVNIVSAGLKTYLPEEIEILPQVPPAVLAIHDNDFAGTADEIDITAGPFELMQTLKDKLPGAVYTEYMTKHVAQDRSEALWYLMCSLFESGLDRVKVFWLAKHSANNKFAIDLRYNADRELAKDVLRAEQKVKIKPVNVKSLIDQARIAELPKMPGGALFKRRNVLEVVVSGMKFSGQFVKVVAGLPYFIPNDTGRPIALTHGSEQLRALLNLRYGINAADPEYKYIHTGILDTGISIDNEIDQASLSYYDARTHTMYFHPGRKDVIKVTAEGSSFITNGSNNILFPWHEMFEPFALDMNKTYNGDWADAVFGDVHSVVNMEPKQAQTLLKVWLIFSLFRNSVSQRPILALFGPPGSGKSSIPHFIYTLLYSRRLAVQGITNPADFDTTSAKLPVYCIDNLDTYIAWILDKLAQAIGDIDIMKRKLYTDVDVIRERRQALIAVTAHNPKFTREDITGRLLLIVLDEIKGEALFSETDRVSHIIAHRPQIWASILQDVIKVLQTPRPEYPTVKWRIQDFASLGEWIAIALDCQDEFNHGMRAILGAQVDTLIHQEELLTKAIQTYISYPDSANRWLTSGDMWSELLVASGDQKAFATAYKNAVRLNQKLQTMRTSLQHIARIDSKVDQLTRINLWRIAQVGSNEEC
jgi:hypothetical protein